MRKTDNQPPQLQIPSPNEDQPISVTLFSERNIIAVLACDPEQDQFTATWRLGAFVMDKYDQLVDPVGDGCITATIALPRDPSFDGQALEVFLRDPAQEVTMVTWRLTVPPQ